MTIQYYSRHVFGQRLFYLVDFESYRRWNSITGRKTITESEMNILSALTGVQFERVMEPEA